MVLFLQFRCDDLELRKRHIVLFSWYPQSAWFPLCRILGSTFPSVSLLSAIIRFPLLFQSDLVSKSPLPTCSAIPYLIVPASDLDRMYDGWDYDRVMRRSKASRADNVQNNHVAAGLSSWIITLQTSSSSSESVFFLLASPCLEVRIWSFRESSPGFDLL